MHPVAITADRHVSKRRSIGLMSPAAKDTSSAFELFFSSASARPPNRLCNYYSGARKIQFRIYNALNLVSARAIDATQGNKFRTRLHTRARTAHTKNAMRNWGEQNKTRHSKNKKKKIKNTVGDYWREKKAKRKNWILFLLSSEQSASEMVVCANKSGNLYVASACHRWHRHTFCSVRHRRRRPLRSGIFKIQFGFRWFAHTHTIDRASATQSMCIPIRASASCDINFVIFITLVFPLFLFRRRLPSVSIRFRIACIAIYPELNNCSEN